MATAERVLSFQDDESGASYLEFTIGMTTFFLILFGVIEFTYVFYQWNAATKGVQFGARLAAVSEPVASSLTTMTGVGGGVDPGEPMPSFDITCDGASASCTTPNYTADAMNVLVYGRDAGGNTLTQCGTTPVTDPLQNGMCNYFNRILPQNVVVRYQHTGLGYAGRPGGPGHTGGPVPTITVSVTGIKYDFLFLKGLMGFGSAWVPPLDTTVTGEDLNASGS